MKYNLCEVIRKSCEKVASQAEHVIVNQDKLQKFVQNQMKKDYLKFEEFESHYSGDNKIDYIFVLGKIY